MISITVESPSGKRKFFYEFADVDGAKKLLEILSAHGFEAAQQYVQRIGGYVCKICGKHRPSHIPNGHKFIPVANR